MKITKNKTNLKIQKNPINFTKSTLTTLNSTQILSLHVNLNNPSNTNNISNIILSNNGSTKSLSLLSNYLNSKESLFNVCSVTISINKIEKEDTENPTKESNINMGTNTMDEYELICHPTKQQEDESKSLHVLCYNLSNREIVCVESEGEFSKDEFRKVCEVGLECCFELFGFVREEVSEDVGK